MPISGQFEKHRAIRTQAEMMAESVLQPVCTGWQKRAVYSAAVIPSTFKTIDRARQDHRYSGFAHRPLCSHAHAAEGGALSGQQQSRDLPQGVDRRTDHPKSWTRRPAITMDGTIRDGLIV
jgi:hypothetical protein